MTAQSTRSDPALATTADPRSRPLVSIAMDGFDTTIVPPLAIELVIGGVLLAAHYTLN